MICGRGSAFSCVDLAVFGTGFCLGRVRVKLLPPPIDSFTSLFFCSGLGWSCAFSVAGGVAGASAPPCSDFDSSVVLSGTSDVVAVAVTSGAGGSERVRRGPVSAAEGCALVVGEAVSSNK